MRGVVRGLLGLSALAVTAVAVNAQPYEVVTRSNVEYVEHDGVKLAGDLYLPKGLAKAPILIAVHGGGWQAGSRSGYRHWGHYLAKQGFGVFAISYRLSKPGTKSYPEAVYDVKAAVQFTRANAAQLSIDSERIGLIGDFSRRASRFPGGARRRRPAVLLRIPRRTACPDADERQGGDRLLRRL